VDIYGHCTTTVWTECFPHELDLVLPNVASLDRILDTALQELAHGLADLHQFDIMLADLQAKQFLVSSDFQTIKLNDFNRCRFLPHKKENTTIKCPIQIPSAPGYARSPEEYDFKLLTEELKVYSLAHVLYKVLTRLANGTFDLSADQRR
jgi:serine/threonine protein kinase